MRYRVVTTCHPAGWEQYGRRCLQAFDKHWAPSVPLTLYGEGPPYPGAEDTRAEYVDLEEGDSLALTVLAGFKERHSDKDLALGRPAPRARWEAVRWAHKVAVVADAADRYQGSCDVLIWLDADVVTHDAVGPWWLSQLFPRGHVLAWPYRRPSGVMDYPECGVMMFDLQHRDVAAVMASWLNLYRTDKIFDLAGWTDTHALMFALEVVIGAEYLKHTRSLSGDADDTSHPIVNGPLGARLDHMKGASRKERGRSHPHDIRKSRPEPYWRR